MIKISVAELRYRRTYNFMKGYILIHLAVENPLCRVFNH